MNEPNPDNMMAKNNPGDTCDQCGAPEVEAMTPRTVYACGSSDYDHRPGTFTRGENCVKSAAPPPAPPPPSA